jgi:hypothetical protein
MDTVFKLPPENIYYDREKNVIWSPGGGCGDDRAGVFAILKILQSGLRPTIIFTTDEESGGLGAVQLVTDFPDAPVQINYIIQLDRRGSNDCVFYDCDNEEFEQYVETFGFVTNFGSFSDISMIGPDWGMAGVNLSIGYINEHSVSETVHVSAMLNTIAKVKNMLTQKDIPAFEYIPSAASLRWTTMFPGEKYGDEPEEECKICSRRFSEYDLYPVKGADGETYFYCPDCMVNANNIGWCGICGEAFETDDDKYHYICKDCGGKLNCSTSTTMQKSSKNSTKLYPTHKESKTQSQMTSSSNGEQTKSGS